MKMELGPVQNAWLAELRSGRHTQGKRWLHQVSGEKCCLGVACWLQRDTLTVGEFLSDGIARVSYDKCETFMPGAALDVLGLLNPAGNPTPGNGLKALAHLNDSGASFAEIADILEKHAEHYFSESK